MVTFVFGTNPEQALESFTGRTCSARSTGTDRGEIDAFSAVALKLIQN